MRDFHFRLIYFLIICFVIYENYKVSQENAELNEVINLQNRAIQMQNILIEYQKKSTDLIETDQNLFYNPLNRNSNKNPI